MIYFYKLLKTHQNILTGTRCVISILLAIFQLTAAAQTPSREYQLKSVFLFNFTQFVEWPKESFLTNEAPLVIGVLGDSPFGSFLEEVVAGEKVNGHPVIIHYYKAIDEIKSCHILFITNTTIKLEEQALAVLKGRSTLTVGDTPGFLNDGGMVRFFTRDNKVKLQINPESSKAANLTISSKLLKLAEIFTPR